jgi:hypothetical protein
MIVVPNDGYRRKKGKSIGTRPTMTGGASPLANLAVVNDRLLNVVR